MITITHQAGEHGDEQHLQVSTENKLARLQMWGRRSPWDNDLVDGKCPLCGWDVSHYEVHKEYVIVYHEKMFGFCIAIFK